MPLFNPDDFRPRSRRLVVAVRGPAGVGKSYFAASLAESDSGRLCLLSTEGKIQHLPGYHQGKFDAFEVPAAQLPDFVEWAVTAGKADRGFGCFALDSFGNYFGARYADLVLRVREKSGDPAILPSGEQLQAEQVVLQRVLRALSVTSGCSVCITDTVGRGIDEAREGEVGRLLPFSIGGLEFFCDVVLEVSLEIVDFQMRRRFRVTKSNIGQLPIGHVFTDIGFADLISWLRDHGAWEPLPVAAAAVVPVSRVAAPAAVVDPGLARETALAAFLARAAALGLPLDRVVASANVYCQKGDLSLLTLADLAKLEQRLASYGASKSEAIGADGAAGAAKREEEARPGGRRSA